MHVMCAHTVWASETGNREQKGPKAWAVCFVVQPSFTYRPVQCVLAQPCLQVYAQPAVAGCSWFCNGGVGDVCVCACILSSPAARPTNFLAAVRYQQEVPERSKGHWLSVCTGATHTWQQWRQRRRHQQQ